MSGTVTCTPARGRMTTARARSSSPTAPPTPGSGCGRRSTGWAPSHCRARTSTLGCIRLDCCIVVGCCTVVQVESVVLSDGCMVYGIVVKF